jgi:hypothetical protein
MLIKDVKTANFDAYPSSIFWGYTFRFSMNCFFLIGALSAAILASIMSSLALVYDEGRATIIAGSVNLFSSHADCSYKQWCGQGRAVLKHRCAPLSIAQLSAMTL